MKGRELYQIWVYLAETPLLWLTATLIAYVIGERISRGFSRHPLANPVIISTALLVTLLAVTGTPYPDYFAGAQFIHFLLGPATVALAIPLWRNRTQVRRNLLPMVAALLAGSLTAVASAVAIAWMLGAPREILASLAPKSVTSPIAMALAEPLGGIPALTAVLVVLTGVLGAVVVTPLMNLMRIRDFAARGFAAGVASHGLGTARAFQVSEEAGTFAGIALGLNGAMTAIIFMFASLFL
ncbi:MAG TPA: LrgB family protein [Paracoccaceae bacterium]|nr:LrgB family protein [Paracoccaceae bacterium]